MAYDSLRQRVVLFGGNQAATAQADDTWEWNGTAWQSFNPLVKPAGRNGHAMAYGASRQKVVLFGGDVGAPAADTWEWDGSNWSQQAPLVSPPARRSHAAAYDATRQRVVVFGGDDSVADLDDTWINGAQPVIATATAYGTGCGVPPLRFVPDNTALPLLGQTASAIIMDAPTPFAGVTMGVSNQFFGPFPLPVTLAGVGMPGCFLLQSQEVPGFGTTPLTASTLSFDVGIPNVAGFLGAHLYIQAYCLAPGANPLQLIVSNGIDWRCGDSSPPSLGVGVTESFVNNNAQDTLVSGGSWGGSAGAGARAGLLGGDGRHGSFDPSFGTSLGNGVYEWSTDNQLIPASATSTGVAALVTDGRFFFTDLVVPAGITIRFVGSVAPVLTVRGQVNILGIIEVRGQDASGVIATSGLAIGQKVSDFPAQVSLLGQPGTSGGAGGARGGNGGDRCNNTGPVIVGGINLTDGQPGENVRVSAGHAYASTASMTGGRGSLLTPVSGIWGSPVPTVGGVVYCAYFSPGGGGGGFHVAGGTAATPLYVGTSSGAVVATASVAGGSSFDLMPFPPVTAPPGYSSLEHFTVGGSGGGGGGSHGYGLLAIGSIPVRFMSGTGGTGGGGAVAIRAGGTLAVGPTALLSARGGDGVIITGSLGQASPGGGGSGGSFLLQSGQSVSVLGVMDTEGGIGSRNDLSSNSLQRVQAAAGDGAPGYFRLEAPGSNVNFAGASTPAFVAGETSGDLLDRDERTGDRSLWYATGTTFPPVWERYELDVDLDGDGLVDLTYTDSGAPGTMMADEPGGPSTLPLVIRFQGGLIDPMTGEPATGTVGPWRAGIGAGAAAGIYLDSATGVRFELIYNRALFPNAVVQQLRIVAHG